MRSDLFSFARRAGAVAVVACALSIISVGAAVADVEASCDDGLRQILQDNGDAIQVERAAQNYGTIQQTGAAAGMTCMDQAMGVTGRLGSYFSDVHDQPVPPANTVVFTPPLAYPDWGAGEFLVEQLSTAVTPMLATHLGNNFSSSLGSAFGFNMISNRFTDLIGGVTGKVSEIGTQIASFSGQVNSILSAIENIQTLARVLNLPMPSPLIIGAVGALEAAQRIGDQLMGALQSAMNAAVQPLIGQVMDQVMGPAADMDCNNISTLWNGGDQEGLPALTGGGANLGAPFLPMTAILQGVSALGGTGYGSQLQSGQNMDILNRALNHLTDGGLARPGVLRSWRAAPSFGRATSTDEIIRQMNLDN